MKFLIVFVALFAVVLAFPGGDDVKTLHSESDVQPEGYKFGYETSDGTSHVSEGKLKDVGTEKEGIVIHGSYKFVADDGKTYEVQYTADENGFQPKGDHIPVS